MVYGFERDSTFYDTVLTLFRKDKNITSAYGFLSRISLNKNVYIALFKYIKEIIETPFIEIEVVPELIPVYRRNFKGLPYKIILAKESALFSGQKSTVFKIKLK